MHQICSRRKSYYPKDIVNGFFQLYVSHFVNLLRTHNDKVVQLQDLYTQLQSGTISLELLIKQQFRHGQ